MNLTALQHSPFLQSLGWAIANSLWQAAALWIAYHLVNGIYKGASARFKNNLSTILLLSAFAWFCITLFSKYYAIQTLLADPRVQVYQVDIVSTTSWNTVLNKVASVLPYLSVAYLFLLIFLSVRLLNIYRYTRFIKFNGLQKPAVEWKLFTEKVARHMGITKKIRIWVSHHIDVPATIGFMKPVILIPLASINQLTPDQLEAIILHELSHIKRNDYLINLFISIIETILFFNPFVVLLAKVIKRERENCCDDFVIQYQYDRHAYASALLSLEQFRNMNLRLAIGATSGKKQLLIRVKRIMEINNSTNFNYGQKLVALLLITGVICSVAWLSPESKQNKARGVISNASVLTKKIDAIQKSEVLPGILFLSQNENLVKDEIKEVVVKPQTKKAAPKTGNLLKELKALSLQEIALREYKLANRLTQESRKEIVRKNLQKINLNKFLMSKAGYYTLFDGKAMVPFNAYSYADAPGQNFFSIDMQKLQSEMDKVQLSFSIDCEQVYKEAQQAFTAERLKSLKQSQKIIKDVPSGFEEHLKTELKKAAEKDGRRVRNDRVKVSTVFNNGSIYFVIDTLIATEVVVAHGRSKPVTGISKTTAPGENKNIAPVTRAYVYANTNGNNVTNGNTVTIDEREIKRYYEKVITVESTDRPASVKQSKPGATYHRNTNAETAPAKIFTPKHPAPQTQFKGNFRVDYKNGVVVINGKKLEMPETREIFALHQVKGKKLLSKAKDLVETHIDD